MADIVPRKKAGLAFEQGALIFYFGPVVGVGGAVFALDDGFPAATQFGVQCDEIHLILGYIVFGKNRLDRAFSHAKGAINAFSGVDHQKIRALAEAIHGTDIHAIGVFALDAGFGNDVGHTGLSKVIYSEREAGAILASGGREQKGFRFRQQVLPIA